MPVPLAADFVRRALPPAKALVFGSLGGAVFSFVGLPLAWMLGSLFAVALCGRLLSAVDMPKSGRDILVPVIGVLLGSSFTPTVLAQIARWPAGFAAIAIYVLLITGLGMLYFSRIAKLDRVTAFFASLPGGLSDMTLLGAELGADLGRLALIHVMRIVAVVSLVPLSLALAGHTPSGAAAARAIATTEPLDALHVAALIGCAVIGSWGGHRLRIPAAAVMGPMLLSAVIHLSGMVVIVPPRWLVIVAQIVLGAYIGTKLAAMHGATLRGTIVHGLFWGALITAGGVGFAALTAPVTGIPFTSLLLAAAPGGLAEMAVLTLALGIDVAFVATSHLLRLMIVYIMTPVVIRLAGWRR